MSDIYSELQPVVADVLREFKQGVIQYVEMVPGSGPADDPGPATPQTTTINAVARGVSFKYVDNSLVLQSDFQVTMPGDGVEPNMSGFIKVDGVPHKIIKIIRKPAAGPVVAWVPIIRK